MRADRVPLNCSGSGLGITLFTSAPDVHIGDRIFYSINVFNGIAGTGRISCDATSIKAFIVTPDGLTNFVTLRRTTLHNAESDFYPDVVGYTVRAQDIRADGTVRATASDDGDIHQNDTDSRGGGDQGVNTEVNLPCVKITALCVAGVGENGRITFTGTVTNCGNNTLVGVTVTNFHDAGNFTVLFPVNLARGEAANFSGSYVPLNPCAPNTAILTVRATDEFTSSPRVTTNFTTITCQNTLTPGIVVTKVCPVTPVGPGELLTFSGSVSNTGNVTLNNIVVVNNQPAANTSVFTLASLAPGAVANFTGSYLAPTACSVVDTLTATATSRCGGNVTSSASATCPILTTPQILVTANCPATPVVPGGTVTYSGTVRNTGNISLSNVIVVSDRPGPNTTVFTVATLAPGATANFSGTYTVPANACTVTTTFSGSGKDICTLRGVTSTVATTCTVTTAPAIAVTLACPAVSASAGGPITYTGTVRNSGNVTLNNVTVVNAQSAPATVLTVPSLLPGASVNFTATIAAPADACSVSSSVTASGSDNCTGAVVANTASATCALITTPSIVVTQSCPATPATPGSLLTYSGTVRNSGNVTLTNVVVLNNLSGSTPVFTTAVLAPGEVAGFSGSYLAPTNCTSTSIATATGRSTCGVAVTHSATTVCPIQTAPQLVVTMNCPVTPVVPGGTMTYSGTVRNTGNITVNNVTIVSDRPAANTTVFTVVSLAPGASANFTSSVPVPANACSVTTVFSSIGRDLCSLTMVTNSVATTCTVTTAPAIAVTLVCPIAPATAGGPIIYTGTVRNSGNVTLNNVTVVNSQTSPATVLTLASLAPGASANFTANFTAPADACSVSSSVTATGTDNCTAAVVSNSAAATCTLLTTPGIVVTENCPVTPVVPGALLTYSGTVRNSGNVTLTNVVVVNNVSGVTPVFTAAALAPGAVASYTGSYLAPTNCSTTSAVTATGRSLCGVLVTSTASATCPILTLPAITVTQTCPTTLVLPGSVLTYTATVRNSGNFTLTNIVVVSDRPGANTRVFTLASLAPGASANFTGSYTTHEDCCVDSSTLTASGQGCAGVTVTDTATRTCILLTQPRLVVTKVCPPGTLRPGDRLNYSGIVSNAGSITLLDVTVNNSQTPGAPVFGPVIMAPGEWFSYSASYVVPEDFCGTDTVTARGLDICTLLPVVNSMTTTCPILTSPPRIALTKECPLLPTPRGGVYAYTGTVSNPGRVTLVNVFVVDNYPTNNTPLLGPITLAPGASANFRGSAIAPTDCCEIIDTATASGLDRCAGSNVTAFVTTVCPLLTTPAIRLVQICPATPILMGSVYSFGGFVTNTGDVVLTNVFVYGPQGAGSPLVGPIELAPGESEFYFGSYTVPFDTCSVSVTARGQDVCRGNVATTSVSCPVATTPGLSVVENCPPGPISSGSLVLFGGSVRNTGNVTLTNVLVYSSQPNNSVVLGPLTLLPGATAPFAGSYVATGGSNPTTNTIVLTNGSQVITTNTTFVAVTNTILTVQTNVVIPTFGTIDPVGSTITDRFTVPNNLHGLMFADQDQNWGPTLFYTTRHPVNGADIFDTVSTIPPATGVVTDRFNLTSTNYDALTLSAPDVGYGSKNFYYVRHDNAGASTFGVIKAAGASSSSDLWAVPGSGYNALAFAEANVGGYGANLFYYLRQDVSGRSTFGTINPTPGGIATDRYTVGTNFDALVFIPQTVSDWGTAIFAYLRHDNAGSIIGTIDPVTHVVTDRIRLGTNFIKGLTFAATSVGYGPNLFYYLLPEKSLVTSNLVTTVIINTVTNFTTNTVATTVTNRIVTFTPTNTVMAVGTDICQARTVTATANCPGTTGLAPAPVIRPPTVVAGSLNLQIPTESGVSYTVQYKNCLSDPVWTDLETVVGSGGILGILDAAAARQPMRFYRVILTP
ncbi:hypothetical protein LBMAG56_36240 [Verrucomicrobiota bacterium]|nr:hypothetical protein LBMAG56_36240 [Verrucomicrobiota bacterium]